MNAAPQPGTKFGRREYEVRFSAALAGHAKGLGPVRLVGLFSLICLLLATAAAIFWTFTGIAKLHAEMTGAEQRVTEIVNRPVTHLSRSGPVTVFSPGWFHSGSVKPDFNTVDIRTTQEFPYHGNVTSDVNPSEMFIGSELEFNAMIKYFYRDRALPKKRLSGAEMVEINGLYRAIGRDEGAVTSRWLTMAGLVVVGLCLAFGLLLLIRANSSRAAG